MENTSIKMRDNFEYQEVSITHLLTDILPTLVPSTPLKALSLTSTLSSTLSIPVKRGCKRPQKYPIQTNLPTSSDICFVIYNPNYGDVNVRLFPYTLSRQK